MSQTEVQLIKADAVQTADIANSAVTDAKISALTSSKLTGALPAISGASLTNLPASGRAHNLVINGAMQVAQRGTSSTSSGYQTLDRFPVYLNGADENPTVAQADIASGTTPYTLGFRKSLKITNGNQTSGAGSNDYIWIQNKIEAQDIANSGWNYLSASSYITLSFWVKSSVAQTFKGYIETMDGTAYQYPFETGSLSADTWTKITKSIPGNSNLQFDNNNAEGFKISIIPMMGTDKTASSVTEDAWSAYSSSARIKDVTTTWYTTNDATFEITGVQLELGQTATDFEHRSFGQELLLCQRYYEVLVSGSGKSWGGLVHLYLANETHHQCNWTEKRATPTLDYVSGTNYYRFYSSGVNVEKNDISQFLYASTKSGGLITSSLPSGFTQGKSAFTYTTNANCFVAVTAEL